MASGDWGSKSHRAGLFPLPLQYSKYDPARQSSGYAPSHHSARVRSRIQLHRTTQAVTNRCIHALNSLYGASAEHPLSIHQHMHMHIPLSCEPTSIHFSDKRSFASVPSSSPGVRAHHHPQRPQLFPNSSDTAADWVPPCKGGGCSDFGTASRAQQRLLDHVRGHCAAFVNSVRAAGLSCTGSSDVGTQALDALASFRQRPELSGFTSCCTSEETNAIYDDYDLSQTGLAFAGAPPFYSSHTTAVPIVASRVALPSELNKVPLTRVLPPHLVQTYNTFSPSLLRSEEEIDILSHTDPIGPPRIGGSRAEYVALVGRMHKVHMMAFTNTPLAVNGMFCVGKDVLSDRVIIDARPANRLFVDSPHVELANPSHLASLQIPRGSRMLTGKSDLSNFYHHLELPRWMCPFFCLPPLRPEELLSLGLDPAGCGGVYPMCTTLPMGFSHAVFLAQESHMHVLYSVGAVRKEDNLVEQPSFVLCPTSVVHGIVIDDFFLFSLSHPHASAVFARVLAAYKLAGFVVKPSKIVAPTLDAVKVIGMQMGGPLSRVQLPAETMRLLLHHTLAVLQRGSCTGLAMSHVIGRWTWAMLLCRPSLAVLQRVYHFIERADRRRFRLWPSVRWELWTLLGLAPLLLASLDAETHPRIIASDASLQAAGVVVAPLSAPLHNEMQACCGCHTAIVQQLEEEQLLTQSPSGSIRSDLETACDCEVKLNSSATTAAGLYKQVSVAPWTQVVSAPWRYLEHINVLELRAVALALHWLLSYPSAMRRRVFLLVDSTVALFSLLKGRSSSPQLLFVLRKIGALLLASGVCLLSGWLPSAINPADAASRPL